MERNDIVYPVESKVLHRFLDVGYPNIEHGEGVRLFTTEGVEILDACSGGAMVATLGYGVQDIINVAEEQARRIPYIYNEHFSNEPRELLAKRLIDIVAPKMDRVRFTSSGSEANEMALRLIRKYHVECGDEGRYHVISQAQSYHGSSMATLALTGRVNSLQAPFAPYLSKHLHIAPSTKRFDPTGEDALKEIDKAIEAVGSDSIAAFVCEPVSASALPGYSPPERFWEGLAARREKYGFLVWFDEVVTGLGRVGEWLAGDALPIDPDVVTLGKGLGAGYAPLSAMLCTKTIYQAIADGSGDFELGHTWDGAPLSCSVGLKVLELIEAGDLVARVRARGPKLLKQLQSAVNELEIVGEVRGQGFLLGMELVDPMDGESILPVDLNVARMVEAAAFENGVLVMTTHPNADGYASDQVLLAPAYVASDSNLEEMIERLSSAIRKVELDVKNKLGVRRSRNRTVRARGRT